MAATKSAGNITVSIGGTALTNYVNTVDLQNTIAELEATHLGSTATETSAGLASFNLQLGGDFAIALDSVLGPLSTNGNSVTGIIAFTAGGQTVTYTWTSNAVVVNYNRSGQAAGKLAWTATLRLNGAPTRIVT